MTIVNNYKDHTRSLLAWGLQSLSTSTVRNGEAESDMWIIYIKYRLQVGSVNQLYSVLELIGRVKYRFKSNRFFTKLLKDDEFGFKFVR